MFGTLRTLGGAAIGLIALPFYRIYKRNPQTADKAGLIVGTVITLGSLAISMFSPTQIIFYFGNSTGVLLAKLLGIPFGSWILIGGFPSMIKTAYACYRWGFVEGVQLASEDALLDESRSLRAFKTHVDELTPAYDLQHTLEKPQPDITLLTPAQIESIKKAGEPAELKKLAEYEAILKKKNELNQDESCSISGQEFEKLKLNQIVIVIEKPEKPTALPEIKDPIFCFEKTAFLQWIKTKKIEATNPLTHGRLFNNPQTTIYVGLPLPRVSEKNMFAEKKQAEAQQKMSVVDHAPPATSAPGLSQNNPG